MRQLRIVPLVAAALCAVAQREPVPPKPASPQQPLLFSHKKHITAGLKCAQCHPNPDPGEHMTLPDAARCMACHATVAKDKPEIQKLAGFAKSREPIPWVRLYSVPSDVYWNHRTHLEAGMVCENCHGAVREMDTLVKATNVTTMQGCVECHRVKGAGTGCGLCHEDK